MGPILVISGLMIILGATIMFVVAAFQVNFIWGILCTLFYPVQWAFLFMHFDEAWKPWCMRVFGAVLYGFGCSMTPGMSPAALWKSASSKMTKPASASYRSSPRKSAPKSSNMPKSASLRSVLRKSVSVFSNSFLRGGCDLAGTIRDYTPDPCVGDPVTFTYDVKNVGKRTVPKDSYVTMLFIDDECVCYDDEAPAMRPGIAYTHTLAPGQSHFIPKKPGEYTYKLKIAPMKGLVDKNPENNITTGTITVH